MLRSFDMSLDLVRRTGLCAHVGLSLRYMVGYYFGSLLKNYFWFDLIAFFKNIVKWIVQ